MNVSPDRGYFFDGFQVDPVKRLLTDRDGKIISLKPKAFDTLLYLVEHPGVLIEKDELMQAIWPDTIVEENNLNQSISALRRALGERADEHRFIVTVPGRGYRFVAAVTGHQQPEVIEDGDTKASDVEHDVSHASHRSFATNVWTIGAVVVLIAAVAFGIYFLRGSAAVPASGSVKTLAVLPFHPLVASDRNEALELGMADTLISKLNGGGEVIVRPLSSVRRSIVPEDDSITVGRKLNVDAVLEGSIQTSGDRLRVSARLFRTSDGKQLWAGQFDEKLTDIFIVQDSISDRVAAALQTTLGSRARKRQTENLEAYQAYMKGQLHSARLIQPEVAKGVAYFQQAIELDPNYALAYAALANAYRRFTLTSDMPSNEAFPIAKAAALKAVELDETITEAHVSLGSIAFWYDWDWRAAERHYLRALELDPNDADVHGAYAHLLSNTGRHEKALAEAKIARELDPLRPGGNALEAQYLHFAGRSAEAFKRVNETIDLDANFWLAHLVRSRIYCEMGLHAEAIAAASKAKELSQANSESTALIGYSLARSGDTEKAGRVLEELLELSKTRYVPPYNFALLYNALGQREKALDSLEKAFAERDVRMTFLKVEPKWNDLRNEPRFIQLMRQMNF